MAGKDSSFARRPMAGTAFSPPLEVDALERAAADIRPSWAPVADGTRRRSGIEARVIEPEATSEPAPASAPAPDAEPSPRPPLRAAPGLGRDDTTETDLVPPGSRHVLRNMIAVTVLALGAGLALLLVPLSPPRPTPAARPAPARRLAAATPPALPAAPVVPPAAAEPAAEPVPARTEDPAPPARIAASAPSDSGLERGAKRVTRRNAAAAAAKPAKKAAPKAARSKRAPKRATTPAAHLEAGYINDNPF